MRFVLKTKQRLFLWLFYVLGMVLLSGCGGDGSEDTAGIRVPNPQTDEEEEQVAISGVLAIAESSETQQSRKTKILEGITIQLLTDTDDLIDTAITAHQGEFQFEAQVSEDDLPLTLQGTVGNREYSAAIVSLADTITANINDITTSIHQEFVARDEQTEENFNRISELVMFNRFGANREGNPNILPETFLSEDFRDPMSLGNLLLGAAGETDISLIEDVSEDEALLANPDFLQAFATQLRGADSPDRPLHPIQGAPGSEHLFEGLTEVFHAPDQMQMNSSLDEIRMEVLQNQPKKKEKIKELKEQIE